MCCLCVCGACALQACGHVVQYVTVQVNNVHRLLDGKNVDAALTEFGTRFHKVVTEHLQQYQYNSMGECIIAHLTLCPSQLLQASVLIWSPDIKV